MQCTWILIELFLKYWFWLSHIDSFCSGICYHYCCKTSHKSLWFPSLLCQCVARAQASIVSLYGRLCEVKAKHRAGWTSTRLNPEISLCHKSKTSSLISLIKNASIKHSFLLWTWSTWSDSNTTQTSKLCVVFVNEEFHSKVKG